MNTENRDRVLTAEEAALVRGKVREMAGLATKGAIDMACALYNAMYGTTKNAKGQIVPLAEAWEFESFDDYVERELHWHQGTARAYVRVYDELFTKRGLTMATLPDSIQALKILARISAQASTDARELKAWITKSKQLSCCEFEAEAEHAFGFGKGKKRNMGFLMPWNRIKSAMKTVDRAREVYGVPTKGEALDRILADWVPPKAVAQTKTG